jgi:hypothetical protein
MPCRSITKYRGRIVSATGSFAPMIGKRVLVIIKEGPKQPIPPTSWTAVHRPPWYLTERTVKTAMDADKAHGRRAQSVFQCLLTRRRVGRPTVTTIDDNCALRQVMDDISDALPSDLQCDEFRERLAEVPASDGLNGGTPTTQRTPLWAIQVISRSDLLLRKATR